MVWCELCVCYVDLLEHHGIEHFLHCFAGGRSAMCTDYCNENDWQIELRRLKADRQFKVCRLNCGFKLTSRSVLHCSLSRCFACFWSRISSCCSAGYHGYVWITHNLCGWHFENSRNFDQTAHCDDVLADL